MGSLTEILNSLEKDVVKKNKSSFNVGAGEGMLRAGLGQGVAFGFGDELEALYKSRTRGTKYEDELADARAKIKRFRETNPTLAYGSEIGGAILPMIASGGATAVGQGLARAGARGLSGAAIRGTGGAVSGVGKAINLAQTGGIKGAAKLGALQGGLYGAGVGEDAESRIKGAVGGAVLGAGIGKAAEKILPKTTDLAKKFIREGIGLTGGQTVKGSGSLGNLLYGIEASSTSLPGVGAAISQAKTKSLSEFNKFAMIEALEPILNKETKRILQTKLKNVNGTEAYRVVQETLDEAYSKIIPELTLDAKSITSLQDDFVNIIAKSDTDEASKNLLLKRIKNLFEDKISIDADGNKFISGADVKKLQSVLGKDATKFFKKGGFDEYIGEAFNEMKNALSQRINLSAGAGVKLKDINLAFAQLKPIGDAVAKANKTEGIFSSRQLLDAIKQADLSPGRKMTKTGRNLMLNTAREGDQIFGDFVPDSGTASRLIAGASAISPSLIARLILPTFAAQGLYGGSRALTRGLINVPSVAASGGGRVASGLLGESAFNMPQNQMQNLMNYRMQQ